MMGISYSSFLPLFLTLSICYNARMEFGHKSDMYGWRQIRNRYQLFSVFNAPLIRGDILFGIEGGTKTLFVLTGASTLAQAKDPSNVIVPDFVTPSLADLSTFYLNLGK